MNERPTEDFIISKVVHKKGDGSRRERYAKADKPFYHMRWWGFKAEYDK